MRFACVLFALLCGCVLGASGSSAGDAAAGHGDRGPVGSHATSAAASPGPRIAAEAKRDCPAPFDAAPPRPGWNRGFDAAGQARAFYLLLPDALEAPAPVFVAFNGTSEDAAQFATRARLQRFADRGFVVIAPSSNANGSFWPVWDGLREPGHEGDPNPDIALFDQLLQCVAAHVPLDRDRVYVGGHSAGGIFTNHLIQRRGDRIAGAIVGSGIYSQTAPSPPAPLDPMTVLVTWGGDNDRWSGRAGTVSVRDIGFAAEASGASQAYARAPGATVVTCGGRNLGHAWLDGLNDWMIDVLLARPKGAPPLDTLPPVPADARATCALGPVRDDTPDAIQCPASATPGCQFVCQQLADGVVRNRTVGPVLSGELLRLGFDETGCAGCVARCESRTLTTTDEQVLACIQQNPPVDPQARGIDAALPLIDAVNECCAGRDSAWCDDVCGTMRRNVAARAYFRECR